MKFISAYLRKKMQELLEEPKTAYQLMNKEAGEPITMLLPVVEREWIKRGYTHIRLTGGETEDGEFYLVTSYEGNKSTHSIKMFDPMRENSDLLERFIVEQHKGEKKVFGYNVNDGNQPGTYKIRVGNNEEVWNAAKRIRHGRAMVDAGQIVGRKRKRESYIRAPIN